MENLGRQPSPSEKKMMEALIPAPSEMMMERLDIRDQSPTPTERVKKSECEKFCCKHSCSIFLALCLAITVWAWIMTPCNEQLPPPFNLSCTTNIDLATTTTPIPNLCSDMTSSSFIVASAVDLNLTGNKDIAKFLQEKRKLEREVECRITTTFLKAEEPFGEEIRGKKYNPISFAVPRCLPCHSHCRREGQRCLPVEGAQRNKTLYLEVQKDDGRRQFLQAVVKEDVECRCQ